MNKWLTILISILICISLAAIFASCETAGDDDDDQSGEKNDDDDSTGDDDSDDDDVTTDDDDDTTDDDDDTTSCTQESYIYDDGECTGLQTGLGLVAHYFVPSEYPASLDEVSFYIHTVDSPGTAVVEIYTDSDCTDPNDATLAYTTNTVDLTVQGWITIDLVSEGFSDSLISGCWFVRPNQVTGAAYIGTDDDLTWPFYNGTPGNWTLSTKPYANMIRGVGCVGG